MKFKKQIFLLLIFLITFFFSSCDSTDKDTSARIDVNQGFSWAFATIDDTPEDANNLSFAPLERLGYQNLVDVAGSDGKFIWLKYDFEIPEELKDQDLGFFVSYLHFADKVWINGAFSGEYGRFPPKELSSQYISHAYFFPKQLLNQDGNNTLLIKVYCLGRAELSENAFIGAYEDVKKNERLSSFKLSTSYIQFEGGMFAAFLVYIIMFFIEKRKHKEYLSFALSCFFTMQFALMFFAPSSTLYTDSNIDFLFLYKTCMCFCFYAGAHFLCIFMLQFMNIDVALWVKIVRSSILALLTIVTYSIPSYYMLMQWSPLLASVCLGFLFFNIGVVVVSIFNKQRRYKAVILMIGLLPLLIGGLTDAMVHYVLRKSDVPFYMYYGWQGSIICYLIVLCVRFTRTSMENMYLNRSLREEVEAQTQQIKITSKKLETELGRARTDIQMASIVQQKTFEHTSSNFIGWDIGVSYLPLSEVSGDMYDFYNIGHNLNGFSLFDVSGHGIAASLITMLSKNIVYQAFKDNQMENRTSGELLEKINDEITRSKGDAENYLTGLMFQFNAFDGDACSVELANAGHPHPFLYSAKDNEAVSLLPDDTQNQYGAIGIQGMDVCFQDIHFNTYSGDILVCYTDGIIEIQNKDKVQFGRESLKHIIEDNHDLSAQQLVDKIVSSIMEFAGDTPREDDITILVMKRENPEDFLEEL